MNTDAKRARSTKSILVFGFLAFSLPAFLLLMFFMGYTIKKQREETIKNFQNQLNQYGNLFEQTVYRCSLFSTDLINLDLYFQSFLYADSKLDTHLATYDMMHTLKFMQSQEPVYGGFILYKDDFSYYYPSYQIDYDQHDQQNLKDFLISSSKDKETFNRWIPFPFSDRTVLVYITGRKGNIFSVMLDPSLSEFIQSSETLTDYPLIFFASETGEVYSGSASLPAEITASWTSGLSQTVTCSSGKYRILKYPFPSLKMFLCFMVPAETVFSMLNPLQKLLLFAMIMLFFLPAVIMSSLSRIFLNPLSRLEETMKQVGKGNLQLRADEAHSILELKNFSTVFNQMLNAIQNLKLKSYEKQLQTQQAQLQYLQLQIRPHFFLNCLKGIYSMAEKEQYSEIKEIVLSLSKYFRYIFRDIKKWTSLSEELHAVASYIRLQQMNYSRKLQFDMDIAADATDEKILPWILLTLIENSLKHAQNTVSLHLRIKASYATVENVRYLNILVSDNGGGFSEETQKQLNNLNRTGHLYKDYHVGISNIYFRMNLAYRGKAMLLFYNQKEEACSELFIPLDAGEGEAFE